MNTTSKHAKPSEPASPRGAVLFDLDGTLIDTAPDFAVVVNQLRQRHGREALPYPVIRSVVSNGARAMVTLALDVREDDPRFNALREELLALYSAHLAVHTALFEPLDLLLDWLDAQRQPWGIVTNKPSLYALPIVDQLGLASRCQALVCPDHVSRSKPDPEPLLLACRQTACEPSQSIYIGDHRRDIEAGQRAGMRTIATAYGYIDADDDPSQWGADHLVATPAELLPLLRRIL